MADDHKYDYCVWEGDPCIIIDDRWAWFFSEYKWKGMHVAEAATKASLIGKAEFDRLFGQLPRLPQIASEDLGSSTES
jgi:hypothetical protein